VVYIFPSLGKEKYTPPLLQLVLCTPLGALVVYISRTRISCPTCAGRARCWWQPGAMSFAIPTINHPPNVVTKKGSVSQPTPGQHICRPRLRTQSDREVQTPEVSPPSDLILNWTNPWAKLFCQTVGRGHGSLLSGPTSCEFGGRGNMGQCTTTFSRTAKSANAASNFSCAESMSSSCHSGIKPMANNGTELQRDKGQHGHSMAIMCQSSIKQQLSKCYLRCGSIMLSRDRWGFVGRLANMLLCIGCCVYG
jgi:hypothetical protein